MSVEQTISKIGGMTQQERDTLRKNAIEKLASGDPKWIDDAPSVLTALDDFEVTLGRIHSEARRQQIAALEGKSASERIFGTFVIAPPSETELKLIRVLLDNPGSTCAELSTAIGWNPHAWDMGFGSLCSQRMELLWPLEPIVREEKKGFIRLLTTERRGEDQNLRYTMKPEASDAFGRLGLH